MNDLIQGFIAFVEHIELEAGRSLNSEAEFDRAHKVWCAYSGHGFIGKKHADSFARSIVEAA